MDQETELESTYSLVEKAKGGSENIPSFNNLGFLRLHRDICGWH